MIVIKTTITVIMKITIVSKLIKIVVQSHISRTYVQILIMPSNKFKRTYYRPTLPHRVQRNKGTKNKDLHALPSILRPKRAIVFMGLLQ